jgi:beta-fructofuranosidase
VEEIKSLRENHVNVSNKAVKSDEYFEVTGFKSVQVDYTRASDITESCMKSELVGTIS